MAALILTETVYLINSVVPTTLFSIEFQDLKSSVAMYTEAVNTITEKTAAFDAWNADAAAKPALQALERLVPYDPLSQQIVRLNSEIHAIDDAFYYMERALVSSRNDKVDLGTFLKECRQLARKQFLCKAHLRYTTHTKHAYLMCMQCSFFGACFLYCACVTFNVQENHG